MDACLGPRRPSPPVEAVLGHSPSTRIGEVGRPELSC
jgi:hypothetical protein